MLKKSLLANAKTFKVSIGTQTHCAVNSNKAFAAPGEVVTLTVSYPTGYSNATVSVSPSVAVSKVNVNTFTFVMPYSDVTVAASASVLSFKISVNQSGTGSVNVKSVANYGETVTVTVSPATGHILQNISSSDVTLSGSGNTRTFVMPAKNVTITVAFQQDYHIVVTVGGHKTSGIPGAYRRGYVVNAYGSVDRIPYWGTVGMYLQQLVSLFNRTGETFSQNYVSLAENKNLNSIKVNGKTFTFTGDSGNKTGSSLEPPALFDSSSEGKEVRIKFDPPLPDIYKKVKWVFTRAWQEGTVNAA